MAKHVPPTQDELNSLDRLFQSPSAFDGMSYHEEGLVIRCIAEIRLLRDECARAARVLRQCDSALREGSPTEHQFVHADCARIEAESLERCSQEKHDDD